jgi:hypothetical protein
MIHEVLAQLSQQQTVNRTTAVAPFSHPFARGAA